MNMNIPIFALLSTFLLSVGLMSGGAFASCTWQTVCHGECQRVPVCDNISDFAPQKHTQNKMLLQRGGLHASPTSGCHQQKVCTKLGPCNYVNICNN